MFDSPLGLIGLAALPAIVALHLFRRRFRPYVVSALFLWSSDDRVSVSGRKRDRLRSSVSLACELIAAACLALALAGPRGCAPAQASHFVCVLDASASMSAVATSVLDGRSSSLRDEASAFVRERIDALPSGSRVSIVQSGVRPRVVAGPGAYPAEALAALERYEPSTTAHDLQAAVALGLQLADGGALVCVTDVFEPERYPDEVELHAVGRPLANVALAHATRTHERVDGRRVERLFARVHNHANAPSTTRVNLFDDAGRALALERVLQLAAHSGESIVYTLPEDIDAVELVLSPDALALDGRAWLCPRPARTVVLASTLSPQVERALDVSEPDAPLARWARMHDDVRVVRDPAEAHLVLGDGAIAADDAWRVSFATLGDERKDFIAPFLIERRAALFEGVTLEGLVWNADPNLTLAGVPLVSAGNLALVTEERGANARHVRFNLDPLRSNLARSPDWPILLSNVVEERRRELPGPERTNLHVGEVFVHRSRDALDARPFTLVGPRTERELAARPWLVIDDFERPGLYELRRGSERVCRIGVSYQDAAESDLSGLSSGSRPARVDVARARRDESWITSLLLLLALLAALVDWWVLSRTDAQLSRFGGARA